jgi:hypothetical protein
MKIGGLIDASHSAIVILSAAHRAVKMIFANLFVWRIDKPSAIGGNGM